MKLQRRLDRVQQQVLQLFLHAPRPEDPTPAEERWVAHLEARAAAGDFAAETDFPAALALYRDALRQAQARADPPFEPPDDYRPSACPTLPLYSFTLRLNAAGPPRPSDGRPRRPSRRRKPRPRNRAPARWPHPRRRPAKQPPGRYTATADRLRDLHRPGI